MSKHFLFSFLFLIVVFKLTGQPVITGISPSSGAVGSTVVITGTGFSATPASNIVYFGSATAVVSAASASLLSVTVPAGSSPSPITVTTGGFTAYSILPFNLSFPGGGPFTVGSFAPKVDIACNYPVNIVTCDLDGDNKPELITTDYIANTISIFKNACTSNTINFLTSIDIGTNGSPGEITVADVDGDGLKDIIIGNSTVSFYRNTSTGGIISFAARLDFPTTTGANSIGFNDIDGDGKPDMVLVGGTLITVHRNTSSPASISFAAGVDLNAGTYPTGLAIADINANGKVDIITCNYPSGTVSILSNTSTVGNISFAPRVFYATGANPVTVAVADLDNDNKADIVVGNNAGSSVSVLQNTGSGNTVSFGPKLDLTANNKPNSIRVADIDGDNKKDIVCGNDNTASAFSIFRNISAGSPAFAAKVNYTIAGNNPNFAIADLTGSGRLDIVATTGNANKLSILRSKIGDAPVMTSFAPASAGLGTLINIKGNNLAGVNAVSFGGTAATSIIATTDTSIFAAVGSGSTGSVNLTTPVATVSLPGFTYNPAITITGFVPTSGRAGQRIKITGNNFSAVPADNIVYFGAARANVESASANTLFVTVPPGATYQPISVTCNKLTAWASKPFQITFEGGSINAGTLIKKITLADFTYYSGIQDAVYADIDNDGKNDIVASDFRSTGNDSIIIFRNTSTNGIVSFAAPVRFSALFSHAIGLIAGDYDGDGKLDIAVANQGSSSINVMRNKSTPGVIAFQPPKTFYSGGSPYGIRSGDLDGDGKTDLATFNDAMNITVFKNASTDTGNISFNVQSFAAYKSAQTAMDIMDFDGDGKYDICVKYGWDSVFSVFRNTSVPTSLSFAPRVDISTNHNYTDAMAAGDLDGDQKPDLVITSSGDTAMVIFKNQSTPGTISFAKVIDFKPPLYCFPLTLADMNGDGYMDILGDLHGNGSSILDSMAIFKNTSSNGVISFSTPIKYFPGSSFAGPAVVRAGDFDGDGKPDMMSVMYVYDEIEVLINQNGSDLALCPGGSGNITSNLVGTVYQWKVDTGSGYVNIVDNAFYSGANSDVLQLTAIPSSWTGYKYRCTVNGKNSKVTSLRFENKWIGTVNSAWENPANWSCGIVPDINTDVVISSGSVIVNSNVTIRTLQLDPDVIFTVNSGYTFIITH